MKRSLNRSDDRVSLSLSNCVHIVYTKILSLSISGHYFLVIIEGTRAQTHTLGKPVFLVSVCTCNPLFQVPLPPPSPPETEAQPNPNKQFNLNSFSTE